MNIPPKIRSSIVYGVPVFIAILVKAWAVLSAEIPFNADEAIVALMARHINTGQIPTFFYGQSYMGSLDALIIALGFKIFDEDLLVIRLLQSLLYVGTVITTILLAKRILKSDKAAMIAGLFISIPTINVTLYTTVSLGGYGEMLLIGNLLLLGGLPIAETIRNGSNIFDFRFYLGLITWGFGAGFGFWVFGLSLVYSIPVIGMIVWTVWKSDNKDKILQIGLAIIFGGLIGSLPWWFDSVISGNYLILSELVGGALSDVNQGITLLQPFTRLVNLFIFGGSALMGLRPPWSVEWLAIPILPLVLIFWIVVFLYGLRLIQDENKKRSFLPLAAMGIILSLGFVLTPFGDDPSGRYFLPLIVPMAVFGAAAINDLLNNRVYLKYGILILVLTYNVIGTIQSEYNSPTGITTQFDSIAQIDHSYMDELVQFLNKENITRGYSNYWVSYPLAFLSDEELIFIPRLPYHEDFRYTARDDRYSPYTDLVAKSKEIAYITTKHPLLDEYLRNEFEIRAIVWKEVEIGDYHIFYHLSEPVYINEIGLGHTTSP